MISPFYLLIKAEERDGKLDVDDFKFLMRFVPDVVKDCALKNAQIGMYIRNALNDSQLKDLQRRA